MVTDENLTDSYMSLMILFGLIKTDQFKLFSRVLENPVLYSNVDLFSVLVYAAISGNSVNFA